MKEDPVKAAEREAQEQMKAAQAQAEQQQAAAMRQVEQQKKEMKKQVAKGMALGLLTGLGTKLFFWLRNKKAIFALLLGTALLTTACKKDDVTPKRFNITVDEITGTSIHVNIVPPDEQMDYVEWAFNEATYNWYLSQENGIKQALAWFEPRQGSYDAEWHDIYPNTKYVLCVGEKDQETKTIVGNVEYVRFQTPEMEAQLPEIEEGEEYFNFYGENYPISDNLFFITGEYKFPELGAGSMNLNLYFVSDKSTGHFTTDDLFMFLFTTPYIGFYNGEGKQEEGYVICGADLTGTYNDATGKNEYKGTVDIYSDKDGLLRLPIFLQCTEDVAEE